MMTLTEKLYYQNPDLFEWETEITEVKQSGNIYEVKLKETAFYPEGGGQPFDLGTIGNAKVLNVQKIGEEDIIHYVDTHPGEGKVFCKIDPERRIDFTQHHSGQHLLSAVLFDLFDAPTVSFHLSPDTATVDLAIHGLDEEKLQLAENRVNQLIYENRKVNIFYIDESELPKYPLRKIPPGHKVYRIVEIEGVEYNACGGTHVKSLGEIGFMKLLKTEKVKDLTRLYFICGKRLIQDYGLKLSYLQAASIPLSASYQQLPVLIQKLLDENQLLSRKYSQLFEEHAKLIAERYVQIQGKPFISEIFGSYTMKELYILASILINMGVKVVLLASKVERKIFLAKAENLDFHCGNLIKDHVKDFSGKGGGDHKKAQAAFSTELEMENFFSFLQNTIRDFFNEK